MYFAGNVPVLQSNTHTCLRKGRLCFCELAGRTAGHGLGGVKQRRPDAFASGENNRKRPEEKASFLSRLFLCFHCARGPCFVSPGFMRKEVYTISFLNRRMGPGAMPLVQGVRRPHRPLPCFRGYGGGVSPLLRHSSSCIKKPPDQISGGLDCLHQAAGTSSTVSVTSSTVSVTSSRTSSAAGASLSSSTTSSTFMSVITPSMASRLAQ